MQKTKVLYIITKLELGGAQLSLLNLIQGMDYQRYDITVATAAEGILVSDFQNQPHASLFLLPLFCRVINPLFDCITFLQLVLLIRRRKFHIVHTHSSKAGILGRWAAYCARSPIIIHTIHGWPFHGRQNSLVRSFYIFLERITSFITTKLIAVTEYDIKQGLSLRIGVKKKYSLIRYGIQKESFAQSFNGKLRRELGFHSADFLVGMIACLKPQKSLFDFIALAQRSLEKEKNLRFLLVGDGVLRSALSHAVRKNNLQNHVFLLGWKRNIPEILSALDALVLTSLWEGLPIVFLEAMASGKPIIATNICGNHEIIQDGQNGFLVPVGDGQAMAEKVIFLARNRNKAVEMGNQGSDALSDSFLISTMVGMIEKLYVECCEEQRGNQCH